MTNTRQYVTVGSAAVIAAAALVSLTILSAVSAHTQPDAPRPGNVVHQVVESSTEASAPSVNLTPNDPAYMETTPAPVPASEIQEAVAEYLTESTPSVAPPAPSEPVDPPAETAEPVLPRTADPTPTPAPSPEARPVPTPCGLAACPTTQP